MKKSYGYRHGYNVAILISKYIKLLLKTKYISTRAYTLPIFLYKLLKKPENG